MDSGLRVLLFCFVTFLRQGSLCNSPGCPGSHSVDQTDLKLTEIHLPLAPEFWNYRHAPSPSAAKTFDRSVYHCVLSCLTDFGDSMYLKTEMNWAVVAHARL